MIDRTAIYVGGEWIASDAPATLDVVNPATEQLLGRVPAGSPVDVDRAATAARRAQPGWAATPVQERAAILRRVALGLRERRDEIVELVVSEIGTPRGQAALMQCDMAIHAFDDAADAAQRLPEVEQLGNSRIRLEPVGVVGCITPWNFPLYQAALKVAPALAAGCTVVLKPSEVAGLTPYLLAEAADAASLPPGVLNLVSGTGLTVGEAIAAHPEVDMVSFTGSVRAGRRVAEVAGKGIKRVTLELGGKSASVVLDDAAIEPAVAHAVASCFSNAGQMCAALSRLVVPRDRLAEIEQLALAAAAPYVPGDPRREETRLGPLVSEAQRRRVLECVRAGVAEGARLLVGAPTPPAEPATGYYVEPAVFSDVAPQMRIAQEEVFGPVLAIIPVDGEEEAVAVANGTPYGLNGAVWSADVARAERVGAALNASTVYVNGGKFNPSAPFGGTKQSGYGRERGRHGLDEYVQTKAYQY